MTRLVFACALLCGSLLQAPPAAHAQGLAVVTVPTANLRNELKEGTPGDYAIDMGQESQVLLGDTLEVVKEAGDWLEVTVPSQKTYKDGKLVSYPGYIQKRFVKRVAAAESPNLAVSAPTTRLLESPEASAATVDIAFMGTYLYSKTPMGQQEFFPVVHPSGRTVYVPRADVRPQPTGQPVSRASLVSVASGFLGAKYFWGGYSFPMQQSYRPVSTGVDCSGLMGVVYRAHGVELPRNAKDIFRYGERILLAQLKRGDFVFISKSADPMKIKHVMMYDGEERFIESTNADAGVVRFSTFPSLFGMNRSAIDEREGNVDGTRWVMAARLPGINYVD